MKFVGILGAVLVTLASAAATASTYTGQTINISTSLNSGTGLLRVGIEVTASATGCGNSIWYAFEYNGSGVGAVWIASLLAAQAGGRQVTISGNNACDGWAMEGVAGISML
jgi:hypothetical protein